MGRIDEEQNGSSEREQLKCAQKNWEFEHVSGMINEREARE